MPSRKWVKNGDTRALIDIRVALRKPVVVDGKIKHQLAKARKRVKKLRQFLEAFEARVKGLEAEDKLGSFEINDLMSNFNQAETLASSVMKARDDTANAIIGKL